MKKMYIGFILLLCFSFILSGNRQANAEETTPEHTFKIMSFNIAHGQGSDNGNVDLERIAKVIEDAGADIVGLQEVDRFYSDRSGYEDQLERIAEILNFEYYVYGANLDLEPHEGYDARQYGTGIISKYPIKDADNVLLNSYGREQRGVLKATIDINGVDVNIYNTHLALPDEDRSGQMKEIIDLMEAFQGPKIVMGDLNSESHFADFKYLINGGHLTDTFADVENANTFRAKDPIKRIDYILTSPLITFSNQEVIQTLASDHLPIVLDATIYEEGRIELTVTDEDNADILLENAVFEVQDMDGNVVASDVVTNIDGEAVIDHLQPGNYQLIEKEAPTDYDLNPEPVSITIGKGEIQKVIVTNGLTKGSVEIITVDQDNNDIQLTDGVFELLDVEANVLQTGLSSDKSGRLIINGLKPGDYQLVQIKAPLNYDLNDNILAITIGKNQQEIPVMTFTNEITTSNAELIMIDRETSRPIVAGKFELQDADGNPLQTGLTVATSGKLIVNNLKPGKYQLVVTESPEGYVEIAKPIAFTIEYNSEEDLVIIIGLKSISNEPDDPDDSDLNGSELQSEVNEIINEDLEKEKYTDISWKAFMEALEEAQAVIEHLGMTQADIDHALTKLKSTKEDLVLKEDGAGNKDDQNDDNEKNDPDNDDQNGTHNKDKQGTNGSNKSDDQGTESGKELPKTATSMFNLMMIGLTVLLSASILLIIAHRRKTMD